MRYLIVSNKFEFESHTSKFYIKTVIYDQQTRCFINLNLSVTTAIERDQFFQQLLRMIKIVSYSESP